jgi:hypothetical protein
MAKEMREAGDQQLKDHQDLEASLMSKVFAEGMEQIVQEYVDKYATWMEGEVMKEDGISMRRDAAEMHKQNHSTGGTLTRQTSGFGTGPTWTVPSAYARMVFLKRFTMLWRSIR